MVMAEKAQETVFLVGGKGAHGGGPPASSRSDERRQPVVWDSVCERHLTGEAPRSGFPRLELASGISSDGFSDRVQQGGDGHAALPH